MSDSILSADYLHTSDPKLKQVKFDSYFKLPSEERIEKTKASLLGKGYKVDIVTSKDSALDILKRSIPKGASVNNGGSVTLQQIGFVDYLKGETGWDNLHKKILNESDPTKQAELRRLANTADYFITSVTAVCENGSFTCCDLSGSRVGPLAHAASNVIVVIGAQKIVGTYEEAIKRTEEFSLPLESARSRIAYASMGVQGSNISNFIAIHGLNPWGKPGRFHFIILKDTLGY